MKMASPRSNKIRRGLLCAGAVLAGFVVLTFADTPIWHALAVRDAEWLKGRDWYQALRMAGYLPVWFVVGLVVMLHDRRERRRHGASVPWNAFSRGVSILLAPALSGLAAEVCKALIRRHRPHADGSYTYEWFTHLKAQGVGIGTVSSHAAVAFGAAFIIARVFPSAKWPLLALAAGCALTRLLAGAHYATDVYGAIILSYAVAKWTGALFRVGSPAPEAPA